MALKQIWQSVKERLFPGQSNSENTFPNLMILKECETMFHYVVNDGKKIPEWIGSDLSAISIRALTLKRDNRDKDKIDSDLIVAAGLQQDSKKLTLIHAALSEIVAPATPLTIEYTIPRARFFVGEKMTIPLIRNMWIMSLLFLLGVILSLYYFDQSGKSIYLSWNILFAAGLGAYFYSLYTANRYYVTRTFDPKYHTFYNNRIIMGILSGFILANIIDVGKITMTDNMVTKLTPSTIALLGGFSAEAVTKILRRIVTMLLALVEGETNDILESKEAEWKSRSELNNIKTKYGSASDLMKIINDNKGTMDQSTLKELTELMNKWLKGSSALSNHGEK